MIKPTVVKLGVSYQFSVIGIIKGAKAVHIQANTFILKNVILMNRLLSNILYNHVINETAPKVNCFGSFCLHRLVTTSAHAHVLLSLE